MNLPTSSHIALKKEQGECKIIMVSFCALDSIELKRIYLSSYMCILTYTQQIILPIKNMNGRKLNHLSKYIKKTIENVKN